jgi:mRNA interferase RelE/StbE
MPTYIIEEVRQLIEKLETGDNIGDCGVDYIFMKGQSKDENFIRIRLGNYRIGAELIDPAIIIITIGSRGDFYKKFP